MATCPVIYIVIHKNKKILSEDSFKGKYGCLYEEYREEGIAAYSIIIFLMRRILALFGLVFLAFSAFAQSMTFFFTSLLVHCLSELRMECDYYAIQKETR